jgi:predicted extracellular nuclease
MPTDAEPLFVNANARPPVPLVGGGRLTVASFNVLNFFNDLDDGTGTCFPSFTTVDCRGADSVEEYERQLQKLVTALSELDADVIGLIEIENDYPDGEASAIDDLVDALNTTGTASCSGRYEYVVPPGGVRVGDDAIAVGILYCAATVLVAPETAVVFLTDANLAELGLDFGEPVFTGDATNRSPLAATFREVATGQLLTVVVNHFKSKSDSGLAALCTDPSVDPNCDQGDGQGYWNLRRIQAAIAIDTWLQADPTGSADPDVLIVSDLNSYLQEDPIAVLTNAGYVNLVATTDAYSYVFDAQAGVRDYALASPALAAQVTGATEWHINADEADALDYDLDFSRDPAIFDGTVPYRASDHDPVLVGLDLVTPAVEIQVRRRIDPASPGTLQILFYANDQDVLATLDTVCGPGEARPISGAWRDSNADGFLDTVGRFVTPELGLACTDTTRTCTGTLRDGTAFVGTSNPFRTIGPSCP